MEDPFAVLGLARSATLEEVRAARRRLALALHPDRGGDEARMREVNRAFDLAVKAILRPRPAVSEPVASKPEPSPPSGARPGSARGEPVPRATGFVEQDAPSFSIDLLPAEAFEALLVVATWNGQVLVDDPPYLLDVHLYEPAECWCRLELVPEAGASMVSITVAGVGGQPPPAVEAVRDLWVWMLNDLGSGS